MSDPSETPNPPGGEKPRRHAEYEDPHYHDDDEDVPSDDVNPRGPRTPHRKPPRRPPPRKPRYED
jgi:hypothetical protein